MIKVYAFEPEAILDPGLSQALEQFGFHHGRIIGAVPRQWTVRIKEIWESNGGDKQLEIRLERLKKKYAIQRIPLTDREYPTWVDRATSLSADTIQGIIARSAGSVPDERLIAAQDLHDDCPVWAVETGVFESRSAEAMAAMATVLLRYSNDVKFVDPYFSGEYRHTDFVKKCLRIREEWPRCETTLLEVHFRYPLDDRTGRSDDELQQDANNVFEGVIDKTARALKGAYSNHNQISLFQWDARADRFHERFLLTNLGAIDYGGGLDSGPEHQRTSVKLLSASALEELAKRFSKQSSPYRLLNFRTIGLSCKSSGRVS